MYFMVRWGGEVLGVFWNEEELVRYARHNGLARSDYFVFKAQGEVE